VDPSGEVGIIKGRVGAGAGKGDSSGTDVECQDYRACHFNHRGSKTYSGIWIFSGEDIRLR